MNINASILELCRLKKSNSKIGPERQDIMFGKLLVVGETYVCFKNQIFCRTQKISANKNQDRFSPSTRDNKGYITFTHVSLPNYTPGKRQSNKSQNCTKKDFNIADNIISVLLISVELCD